MSYPAWPKWTEQEWRDAPLRTAEQPRVPSGTPEGGQFASSDHGMITVDHETHKQVQDYVQGGARYTNERLRHVEQKHDDYSKEQFRKILLPLDSLMMVHHFKSDTQLFRVVRGKVMQDLQPGDVFQDKGYVSTTSEEAALGQITEDIGLNYTGEGGLSVNPNNIMTVEIEAPKGMGHIEVNRVIEPNTQGYVHDYSHQKEIILPRNTKFVVTARSGNRISMRAIL